MMYPSYSYMDCTVLLIGGSSGTGKTNLAKQLGQRFGISWLEVDDLRLALQRSRVIYQNIQKRCTFSSRHRAFGSYQQSACAMA